MKVDFYCFVADSLNCVISKEKRERDSHIYDNLDFDINVAKKLGKFAVYDKETDEFYDVNNNVLSLRNKVVFPRCIIPEMNLLFDKLDSEKAVSIITKEQTEKVYNWPKYIQPSYRDVEITTYGEFLKNFKTFKDKFDRVFFKTKNKNIHAEVTEVVNLQGLAFKSIETDDDIKTGKDQEPDDFFSEPMYVVMTDKVKGFNDHRFSFLDKNQDVFVTSKLDIVYDKENPRIPVEYRTFVVDGKFVTSQSWVEERKIPEEVTKLVKGVLRILPKEMPKTFVLDILEFESAGKKRYDICEFNPICCSGYEEGSSIFLLEDNFSKEQMGYYKFKEKEVEKE